MRIFTRIRRMLVDNTELRLEISEIKHMVEKITKKQNSQDKNVELIFGHPLQAIKRTVQEFMDREDNL